jgi:hypothetical protein
VTPFFKAAVFFIAVLTASTVSAVPASAMGRSEDPREAQVVGTDADPAIRDSDQSLRQLLFKPAAPSSAPSSGLAPAGDRISAAPAADKGASRRE